MKFFEWKLVRCRACCKLKVLRRTSWRRKISAAVIGCGGVEVIYRDDSS